MEPTSFACFEAFKSRSWPSTPSKNRTIQNAYRIAQNSNALISNDLLSAIEMTNDTLNTSHNSSIAEDSPLNITPIPEWRAKGDDCNPTSDTSSPFSSSFSRKRKATSTPNTGSTPSSSTNSPPYSKDELKLLKNSPHALHVYCALEKQKPPILSISCISPSSSHHSNRVTYECKYSCLDLQKKLVVGEASHVNKARARTIAACNLLNLLYPNFNGDTLEIMRFLDKRLKENGLNLRRIIPDEVEINQHQMLISSVGKLKEGFNPSPTKEPKLSDDANVINTPPSRKSSALMESSFDTSMSISNEKEYQQQQAELTLAFDGFNPFMEEPIQLLNDVIHLFDYNFPTCQNEEPKEPNQLYKVTMILPLPNDKGVYYSVGEGRDAKQAKGTCALKMLTYFFPQYQNDYFQIKAEIERLRFQRRKEKAQKNTEKNSIRRKLDFSSPLPPSKKDNSELISVLDVSLTESNASSDQCDGKKDVASGVLNINSSASNNTMPMPFIPPNYYNPMPHNMPSYPMMHQPLISQQPLMMHQQHMMPNFSYIQQTQAFPMMPIPNFLFQNGVNIPLFTSNNASQQVVNGFFDHPLKIKTNNITKQQ
ncbi:hypothetical protein ABK040_013805 [Willaertia magna]